MSETLGDGTSSSSPLSPFPDVREEKELLASCVGEVPPFLMGGYSLLSAIAFFNEEDDWMKDGGASPTELGNSAFSSLTSGNGDNGEEEDVPPPSVSDMELEAEARRQFVKEQMEAEDAPQLLLLG